MIILRSGFLFFCQYISPISGIALKTIQSFLVLLTLSIIITPLPAFSTENYELTIAMPISNNGAETQLERITFETYQSRLETRVSAVTWDPCKAMSQSADCKLINPLHATNVSINVYAYNAADIKNVDGCYVEIDLSRYKPLSTNSRRSLDIHREQTMLLNHAVESLQLNTRFSPYYVDCEIRVKGYNQTSDPSVKKIPQYLNPVIPACYPHTASGRKQAKLENDEGMIHYQAKQWRQASVAFRRAAELDCSYFIARTNLASVYSLQKKFEKSQAVLWRAIKLNRGRTMKKLANDPDYRALKQSGNFYSAASPTGILYRAYCLKPLAPAEVDPDLPTRISQSSLKDRVKSYSVATAYTFEADFNKNGIPDKVYPLLINTLHSVLVVFDGNKPTSKGCKNAPLLKYDLSSISTADPCQIRIFAGADGAKRGIRLEAGDIKINREVCHN